MHFAKNCIHAFLWFPFFVFSVTLGGTRSRDLRHCIHFGLYLLLFTPCTSSLVSAKNGIVWTLKCSLLYVTMMKPFGLFLLNIHHVHVVYNSEQCLLYYTVSLIVHGVHSVYYCAQCLLYCTVSMIVHSVYDCAQCLWNCMVAMFLDSVYFSAQCLW